MVSRSSIPSTHQPRITERDREYFHTIFRLESNPNVFDVPVVKGVPEPDRRIDWAALLRVFKMVGFEPNAMQL